MSPDQLTLLLQLVVKTYEQLEVRKIMFNDFHKDFEFLYKNDFVVNTRHRDEDPFYILSDKGKALVNACLSMKITEKKVYEVTVTDAITSKG